MSPIKFSIIIPHKNSTKLLQYCLDSIPLRDDIQVIVVDDNSDSSIVDFYQFPLWKGNHYECYFTKEGGGAGYARNIGLNHAKGEWILFADADDFLTDKANEVFDKVLQSTSDIVHARTQSVMLYNRTIPSKRSNHYNSIIDEYLNSGNDTDLRTNHWAPWGKFIKLNLIRQHRVWFDEIPYSNDMYFSTKIGCVANSISVINDYLYCVTESDNSLTSNFGQKKGEYRSRTFGMFHANIVSAKYNYIDANCVKTQLLEWNNSDRQLFIIGIECMLKEGYPLSYIIRKIFLTEKFFSNFKHNIKNITLTLIHIRKGSLLFHKKWGIDPISISF